MPNNELVTIFGGSGFIGSNLVKKLADNGYRVRIICRSPNDNKQLKVAGRVGQVTIHQGNINNLDDIKKYIKGSSYVVNLVGVLASRGNQSFENLHTKAAKEVAKAAKKYEVKKLVHISALGADEKSPSKYSRTKFAGEQEVQKHFKEATILRPSVIFGDGDQFFNKFASMAKLAKCLPNIGFGKTKLQPVFVGDVTDAIIASFANSTNGKIYELGGTQVITFKEILKLVLKYTNRTAILMPIPFFIARIMGFFLSILPNAPLTLDQVRSLQIDNIVADKSLGFKDLHITPKAISSVVPQYIKLHAKKKPVGA